MMSAAFGNMTMHGSFSPAEQAMTEHQGMSHDGMAMSGMMLHDCCSDLENIAMDSACTDCEDSDPAPQTSVPDQLKPLFSLLFIIVQQTLNLDQKASSWEEHTEPDVLASRPEIYLAKASFLE
ncbi:hypothetical protein ACWJJH_19575 [Endozoicomonadaceae bacterium StTr2]